MFVPKGTGELALRRLRARRCRPLLLSAALVLSCMAFMAPAASAIVHVDPDGPAGVQYALPLESVRGQAAGNAAAGVPGARTQAPLFGQGIRPPGAAGAAPPSAHGGRHAGAAVAGAGAAAQTGGVGARSVAALLRGTSGDSMTLELVALIGGLVLLGAAAGLIVRRRL